MAKRLQPARLVLADGIDLNAYVTEVNIPLNDRGLTEVTLKVVGAEIDVDTDSRQILVKIGEPKPAADPPPPSADVSELFLNPALVSGGQKETGA